MMTEENRCPISGMSCMRLNGGPKIETLKCFKPTYAALGVTSESCCALRFVQQCVSIW